MKQPVFPVTNVAYIHSSSLASCLRSHKMRTTESTSKYDVTVNVEH